MCSHVCLQLAPMLRQTCELIVCSVWIRFIAYRWQSLLINREVAVGNIYSKTWPDTLRVYCPKRAETFCCIHALVSAQRSEICWAQKQRKKKINKKEKKNDCNLCGGRNAGPLSHFSWSNLEPLFGKQKRAVWLTARDNVKGMKTYTITLAFLLSAHSVALWVIVVLSNKLQAFSLWNQHSLTVNVYDTLIRHRIHNMQTRGVWFTAAVDTCQQTNWMPICGL